MLDRRANESRCRPQSASCPRPLSVGLGVVSDFSCCDPLGDRGNANRRQVVLHFDNCTTRPFVNLTRGLNMHALVKSRWLPQPVRFRVTRIRTQHNSAVILPFIFPETGIGFYETRKFTTRSPAWSRRIVDSSSFFNWHFDCEMPVQYHTNIKMIRNEFRGG